MASGGNAGGRAGGRGWGGSETRSDEDDDSPVGGRQGEEYVIE